MSKKMLDPFLRVDPFLRDVGVTDDLRRVIFAIAHAGKYVAHAIRNDNLGYSESANSSGEKQLTLDLMSDAIFCNHLQSTGVVARFASEEQKDSVPLHCTSEEKFAVAFDPLDGSSLVDTDFAIGSIFTIFRGSDFLGKTGKDIVASGYIIYGPRTVFMVATRHGLWEFTENVIGEFVLSRDDLRLAPDAEYFAPGNLRATIERPEYEKLFLYWARKGTTLRYSGGMVPDIHMMLAKGSGVFAYPSHSKYPEGKLRILFECAPFAFLITAAGGIAMDEHGVNILDKKITALHQRTSIIVGSRNDVEKAVEILNQ